MGSLINVNNDNFAEIKKRILMANKGFYGLERQFRSQFLSIKNKMKLYKTLIRPVLPCGSETWVLSKSDEAILGVFERKILRVIFGRTNDNGEWRIKYNNELYTLYKQSDIVTYIKINLLKMVRTCYSYGGTEPYNKSFRCSGRRKETEGQAETKMGRWCDGRYQEVGGEKLEECCKE